MKIYVFLLSLLCQLHCSSSSKKEVKVNQNESKTSVNSLSMEDGNTIATRIKPPDGYLRTQEPANSFQTYLRELKLKPKETLVKYYNGTTKPNYDVYEAVVDLKIGNKDLHQCADAVMRLRAEYLWLQKQYDKIHFNFTNGHKVAYSQWMKGNRMQINGNKTWWSKEALASNSYEDLWNYLELIFMYAGTASLQKELLAIPLADAEIGDVLIQGGHPGHAVILIDKAIHQETGKAIYLLAQSYMPAQEIQVLKNPNDPSLSPWYSLEQEIISTPEWNFYDNQLMRFD